MAGMPEEYAPGSVTDLLMELCPVNWAPSQMVMWPVKTQAPPTTQYLPKVTEPAMTA